MHKLKLKPVHKPVLDYYNALHQLGQLHISHETAVRSAFQTLLESCCRQFKWTLVPEWEVKRTQLKAVRVDGALVDSGLRIRSREWIQIISRKIEVDILRETREKLMNRFIRHFPLGHTPMNRGAVLY
jgi:hypothetical protein